MNKINKSLELFKEAKIHMPGGVNSPVRAFKNINGNPLPNRNDLEARLIMPDGLDGRMFIVYPNYKNILYYNCSSYYALSVGLLSDKISN